MSTYWGYYCKDCQVETDYFFNHGEKSLEEYVKFHELTKHFDFDSIEVTINGSSSTVEMKEFLQTHEGHNIALKNEYGDIQELSMSNTGLQASANSRAA